MGCRSATIARISWLPPQARRCGDIGEIQPLAILQTPAGETVLDMGQNLVGWVRLQVRGEAGTTVTLRHAEVLDQQGNLYTANLRTADQVDRYTLKGTAIEIYEPHFTFHGFRYVAVEGYPGDLGLDALTGIVVQSDMATTGQFECSNALINQLQHNIVWGQKGNFVDVPTDCPQRDERLGWTGDAQVFIRTACYNMDVAGFFRKWLLDLAADQHQSGAVPWVVPDVLGRGRGGAVASAAWADAATICPWTLYLCYGDRRILEEQYQSMKGWVEYMRREAGNTYLWAGSFHFGDWLAIGSEDERMPAAGTDKDLIAAAFFAYSTGLLQQAAEVLGYQADAADYAILWDRIALAFRNEYVTPAVRMASNTQTAYALALMFDLLPEEERATAADRLVKDIRARANHLSTGFVGTPYLCHALSRFGHVDVAYDLLMQETFPSWLYPVKQGATTIWERWDGIKPNGEFQDPGMNSFNHYAYGAIGDWMYRVVAGLDTSADEPGYRHALVAPQPGGGLGWVRASLETMYGPLTSAWELEGDQFRLQVTVPANTWATVRLPLAALAGVTEGDAPLSERTAGVHLLREEGGDVVVEVGSGAYSLAYQMASAMLLRGRARLGVNSTLEDILADEEGKAVLLRHLPGILDVPMLSMGMGMTLEQIAPYAPQFLTQDVLDAIIADLYAINGNTESEATR